MRTLAFLTLLLSLPLRGLSFQPKFSTYSLGKDCGVASTQLYESTADKDSTTPIEIRGANFKDDSPAEKFYLDPIDDENKPAGAILLGLRNFVKQSSNIIQQYLLEETLNITGASYIDPSQRPPGCLCLSLSNEAVTQAERVREARPGGRVETNPASRFLYDVGCSLLDNLFDERPIPRFWFLETIARVPYFSYVSMLHLYETFGWWREPELRKVHNAQEWNELHHLLIMESLGGNALWSDRFFGYHAAIVYYWAVNALFLFSPKAAYEFMELLEAHAVDTYTTFLRENSERLRTLPPPEVGRSYYKGADLYFFDDFQVSKPAGTRRPPCDNLYDVFKNISEDEGEHVKTMQACQDYAKVGLVVVSPHAAAGPGVSEAEKRKTWREWADSFKTGDLEDLITQSGGDFK